MKNFIDLQINRRSIYALGKNVALSNDELSKLIKDAIKNTPSAFNSQSSRAVILFGTESETFWNQIVSVELQKVTPTEMFENTKQKLAGFAAGIGTILFFEDQDVIASLEDQFPTYAANFKPWSEQSHGIALYAAWLALADYQLGASVQHYNPLIDTQVAEKYNIPNSWLLRAQMPFGSIENAASEKEFIADDMRFKTFGL